MEENSSQDTGIPPQASDAVSADSVSVLRKEYEALLRKSEEFAQLQDRYLRSAADFDNAKKRLQKEREEFLKFALEGTIYELLPVLDNFDRALGHADLNDAKIKSLCDGFRLIQKQLIQSLTQRGLRRLEVLGKPYDPHAQEAMGYVILKDRPEGTVAEELVAGYELNGKLIRPAKVKLSTHKEPAAAGGGEKLEELT